MRYQDLPAITLMFLSTLSGCATVEDSNSEIRRQLAHDLRKSCIESAGGVRMDAVGLYGGRLNTACTQWAYRRARQAVQ